MQVILIVFDGTLPVSHLECFPILLLDFKLSEEDKDAFDVKISCLQLKILKRTVDSFLKLTPLLNFQRSAAYSLD